MTILLSCQSLLSTTDVCQHGSRQSYSPIAANCNWQLT